MYLGECGNDHAEGSKGLVNGRAFLEPGTCTQPQRPQQPRTDKPTTQEEENRGKGPREGTSRAVDQERPRHSVETETQRRETERERERERGKE